eukprot:10738955-Lingulodinium_polyedra.AAC.1
MDEGSPGYAGVWHLRYHLRARLFILRDVYHREWNDVKMALGQAGLWWVVLLTSLTFNLCFGPWEGCAWFEKLVSAAVQYFALERVSNPLFQALYPAICRDKGLPEVGGVDHQQAILDEVASSEAWEKKGPHVANKRWFSWCQAHTFHDSVWHSRLLVLLSLGIQLGIYKHHSEVPLWGGPAAGTTTLPEQGQAGLQEDPTAAQ